MSRFIFPVAGGAERISQLFGATAIDYSRFGLRGHNGLDFAGTQNEPIVSIAAGKVLRVGQEAGGFGHFVVIDIGEFEALYAHLAERSKLLPGQFVPQGGQTGRMGSSGFSTGVHLHLGLRPKNADRKNGYNGYIDPLPFLIDQAASVSADDTCEPAINVKRVRVIVPFARIRLEPGLNGRFYRFAQRNEVFRTTGERQNEDGLNWRGVWIRGWIAERDQAEPLIEPASEQ